MTTNTMTTNTMTTNVDRFAALHQKGNPLVLFNVWDAGSTKAVERAGAKAIATGSFSVAGALGSGDGEKMSLAQSVAVASSIVASTELPVTVDLETGYGDVLAAATAMVELGAVGINLEDQLIGGSGLQPIAEQQKRIALAAGLGLFVNARTDLFIQVPASTHDVALVEQAVERSCAYEAAGARSFFAPFLIDADLIRILCAASTLPVNIMIRPGCPSNAELADLGVARISYGPGPWVSAMAWVEEQARGAFA
jgi:2-methylisocitrate lyase-like PEP mutase family enzyme